MCFHFVAGDRLDPSAFQVIVAAIEHVAGARELVDIALHDILHKLVGGPASALSSQVLESLFDLWAEVDFPVLKVRKTGPAGMLHDRTE